MQTIKNFNETKLFSENVEKNVVLDKNMRGQLIRWGKAIYVFLNRSFKVRHEVYRRDKYVMNPQNASGLCLAQEGLG